MRGLIIFAVLVIASQARPQIRLNFPRRTQSISPDKAVETPIPSATVPKSPVPEKPNGEGEPQGQAREEFYEQNEETFDNEESIEEEEQEDVKPLVVPTASRRTITPTPQPSRRPNIPIRKSLVPSRKIINSDDDEDNDDEEEENLKPRKEVKKVRNYVPNEYEVEQNKNAHYDFNSNVEDGINDLSQSRSESRDGLAVKGMYSYSDGYFKRTVHYEADERGYRIVSMETEPLDLEGPQIDLNGSASISNDAHGSQIQYRVQSAPVEGPKGKIIN